MTAGIVGLGLIGGSLAKAYRAHGAHVLAFDTDGAVLSFAQLDGTVDAVLTANYAIYYENRELWEAKGNVVVEKSDGKTLYTQQLFWNEKTRRIWSNVDSKIVEESGNSYIVEGFESDDQLKDWKFRRIKGRMWVNIEPTRDADSTSVKPVADNVSAAKEAVSEQPVEPARPIRGNDRKIQLTPVESNDRSL